MKKILLLWIVGFWGIFGIHPVWANAVASMNAQSVMNASVAWQETRQTIDVYAKSIQAKVIKRQKILEQEWDVIREMRKETSKREELVVLEKKFMEKNSALQIFVQNAKERMEKSYLHVQRVVQDKIFEIVKRIAMENNYDIVVLETEQSLNSPYLYLKPSLSINQRVIEILNAELVRVDLDLDTTTDE